MRDLRRASITSVLALGLACAAVPVAAQSSSGSTSTPGASSTTGTLPDNSLAGQRQGAMSGGKAPQTGDQNAAPGAAGTSGSSGSGSSGAGSSGSSAPTGGIPDNSLAGQRQGAIGGGSVSQGGAGSTESPQQSKPGSGQ